MSANFIQRALGRKQLDLLKHRNLYNLSCSVLGQRNIALLHSNCTQNISRKLNCTQNNFRKFNCLCFQPKFLSKKAFNLSQYTIGECLSANHGLDTHSANLSSTASGNHALGNSILLDYLKSLCDEYSIQSERIMSPQGKSDKELKIINARIQYLQPIVSRMQVYEEKKSEVEQLSSLLHDLGMDDDEMKTMADKDISVLKEQMDEVECELMMMLVPPEKADHSDTVMEIAAGVGGHEAMLFTKEIFEMYCNYTVNMGWKTEVADLEYGEGESIRRVSLNISGRNVYQHLKYEGGVHRVQRVPKHIKPPRIHTSATTVALLPQPSEIDIEIHPKDLKITYCRASGAGGQHVNTTDSAVRIVHIPTGTVTECQTGRSATKNKEIALKKLRALLFEKEVSDQTSSIKSSRKLQVATKDRSDKIRTYNFPQDRITDHRIQGNMYGIKDFLNGGEKLSQMIERLQEESRKERLQEMLDNYKTFITSQKTKSSS